MQTGRPFTFSKRKMDDSAYAFNIGKQVKFKHDHFPVAAAVAASTCVPVYFSPVLIPKEFYSDIADISRRRPQLVDGGVYDNQGIHKLSHPGSTYECQVIIVSDAGNRFSYLTQCRNNFGLLARTSDVMMQRIKNIQMTKNIYEPTDAAKNKNIAYLSLGWDLEGCIPGFIDALKKGLIPPGTLAAHGIPVHMSADVDQYRDAISNILTRNTKYEEILLRSPPEAQLMSARKVKTGLWPINELMLDTLIAHAENMTELQVKLYCPSLVTIANSKLLDTEVNS
jgi:NTE family protein